jgi:hypothetical protein
MIRVRGYGKSVNPRTKRTEWSRKCQSVTESYGMEKKSEKNRQNGQNRYKTSTRGSLWNKKKSH